MAMGIMSSGLWLTYGIIWFICLLIAAMVGGKLYSEEGTTA
jgi:Ca2+/Na+ antiporter